jgi:Zn-dependent protease
LTTCAIIPLRKPRERSVVFNFSLPSLLAKAVILLVALPIHEFSHAFVAYRLGDDTAARQGRLSLNPLRHLDPLGSLMILFVGFGWAKPVPVNPWRLRHGSRAGYALVAAAGPASNLLLAALTAILWRVGLLDGVPATVVQFALTFMSINVALCLFNLIPLAPLDGSSVLNGIIGGQAARALAPVQTYGPLILMGLFMLSYLSPQFDVLGTVLGGGVNAVMKLLLGV